MKLVDHCKDLRTLPAEDLYQSRVSNSRLSSKLKYTAHGEVEFSILIYNMVPVDFATFAGFVNPSPKSTRSCRYAVAIIARQEMHETIIFLHLRWIRARQQPIKVR